MGAAVAAQRALTAVPSAEGSAFACAWAFTRLRVGHPVVIDDDFSSWRSFDNRYWPAAYLVAGDGRTRFEHFGEGAYEETSACSRRCCGSTRRPAKSTPAASRRPPICGRC